MQTWLRLTLITMTVGGGFAGVVFASQLLFTAQGQKTGSLLIIAVFFALYAFVTVSGLIFVHDPRRTRLLIVAFILQIPWISSPLIVYRFAAGCHAVIGIVFPDEKAPLRIDASAFLGSGFTASLFQENRWSISINLVALLMLIWLLRSIRTPKPTASPITSASAEPDLAAVPGV
jgi:hypothetical protein